MLSYCGSFYKGHIQPNAKISKFVAKTHFYPEKQSSTEQEKAPATHSLENCRAPGNRKATLYYSHIYTKHSQYAFLQPPNTFSGNYLEICWCLQTFRTLCFVFFPHVLFCIFCTLCFVFHTFFTLMYLGPLL